MLAGMRTEPAVSVPSARQAVPLISETPAPELEPPGVRCAWLSQGLRGAPQWALVPSPPKANSTVWVFPIRLGNWASSASTMGPGRSQLAGRRREEPA